MHWVFLGGLWAGSSLGFLTALFAAVMLIRLLPYRDHSKPIHFNDGHPAADEFQSASLEERYAPMARLLAAEDFDFLASQPGYRLEIEAKLRRSRRRLFHLYLRELAADFHRLHAQARTIIADSSEEHSRFVGTLMRQEVAFWRAMFAIEFYMITPGLARSIDVRTLIEGLEAMRVDLARHSIPAAA